MKIQIEVAMTVDEYGLVRLDYQHADGSPRGRLLPGQRHVFVAEVDAREISIGEIAEEVYKTTGNYAKVAAAVVAAHEARKAGCGGVITVDETVAGSGDALGQMLAGMLSRDADGRVP
jgi:hypothetical protein